MITDFSFQSNHGGIKGELPKEAVNQDPTTISSSQGSRTSRRKENGDEQTDGDADSDDDLGHVSDEEQLNQSDPEDEEV